MNNRLCSVAAVLAAAALVVEGAVVAVGGSVPDGHWGTRGDVVNGAFIIAAVALVLASPLLTGLLGLRRSGRTAVVVTQMGFLAMGVESVASQVTGGNTLGGLFFGGLLAALVGSIVVAVDGVRAGRLRWAAGLPALGMLVGIAGGDHGGSIAWGAVWLVLAAAAEGVTRRSSVIA
jgi:hypothetical protein